MKLYAEVVFNIPVKKSFTYLLPERLTVEAEANGQDRDSRSSLSRGMGFRVLAPLGSRKLVGSVIRTLDKAPAGSFEIKPVIRIIDQRPIFDEKVLRVAEWMAWMYFCSLGEALSTILPGAKREKQEESVSIDMEEDSVSKIILAEQQKNAIEAILSGDSGVFYLQGVTGSGKTEVFLEAARGVLGQDREVVYLVPEISLTHQIVERFRGEFGNQVAVLHSAMSASRRLREWMRIRDGAAKLAIGARSAVFAPFPHLGLIIIDEEHEGSYKAGSTPRYHARQVAAYRCRSDGAILLMGSATPSVEAYGRMEERSLKRLLLPRRLSGGRMPTMEIVDMKGEDGPLSRPLVEAIKEVHQEGRQSILFLNRRGFSYYFYCRSCGFEMQCQHCAVSLTYHKKSNQMICHYCGYRADPVSICPACRSLDIGYSGFGTEKIEEEIQELLPGIRARRIDTDAVRQRKDLRETLLDFRNGKLDVLLGTQMVAKGLNFPGVKLVGIVSADAGLQLPDFRALERTFALVVQVSGRAGRVIPDGRVMIQTYKPENPVLQMASRMQLEAFYRGELEMRRQLKFPPFVRLIRIVFRGKSRKKIVAAAETFSNLVDAWKRAHPSMQVGRLGPVDCPIGTISGNHRCHVLLKSSRFKEAHQTLQSVLSRFKPQVGVYLEIDVDPQALL